MSELKDLIASCFDKIQIKQLRAFGFDIDLLPKNMQFELCRIWAEENEREYLERLDENPSSERDHYLAIIKELTEEREERIIESIQETVVNVCRTPVNRIMKDFERENITELIGKNIDHILDDPRHVDGE